MRRPERPAPTRSLLRPTPCAALALALAAWLALGGAQAAHAAEQPVAQAAGAAVPLSLAELVQQTLVRNMPTRAARLQADAAGRLLQAEQALYEPVASSRVRREGGDRPRTYEERTSGLTNVGKTSAIEQINTASAGLRGKLPTGASYELGHEMRRRKSNLLASEAERENRGTLTLTLRQPLLRNAGRTATEADLRVAELEQQVERQRFVKQLVDIVGEAAGTYWQLVRAREQLAVRERALDAARQMREDTRRRVDGGFAPRVDLLEADIALGGREAEQVRAAQGLADAEVRVRNLLAEPGSALGGLRYRPVQGLPAQPVAGQAAPTADTVGPAEPSDASEATPAADEPPGTVAAADAGNDPVFRRMLGQWPGYQIARLRFEQEEVRLVHAGNQQRPDVSVEFGYNQNGLNPSFLDALDNSLKDRHAGWSIGLVFEMPIGNQGARSRREAQSLKRDAARLLMQSEAQTLGNEWAARTGQRDAARRETVLLRQETVHREALWQAERANHTLGRSRLRQLIEAEDRLNDSRSRLIDAQVREMLAELALQALTGELFTQFGVRVEG